MPHQLRSDAALLSPLPSWSRKRLLSSSRGGRTSTEATSKRTNHRSAYTLDFTLSIHMSGWFLNRLENFGVTVGSALLRERFLLIFNEILIKNRFFCVFYWFFDWKLIFYWFFDKKLIFYWFMWPGSDFYWNLSKIWSKIDFYWFFLIFW